MNVILPADGLLNDMQFQANGQSKLKFLAILSKTNSFRFTFDTWITQSLSTMFQMVPWRIYQQEWAHWTSLNAYPKAFVTENNEHIYLVIEIWVILVQHNDFFLFSMEPCKCQPTKLHSMYQMALICSTKNYFPCPWLLLLDDRQYCYFAQVVDLLLKTLE